MHNLIPYLIKVVLISGILYGYYYIALRDRNFHRYNRFFLLFSVVLSLLLPVVKLNFWQTAQTDSLQQILKYDFVSQSAVVQKSSTLFWNGQTILFFCYTIIVIVLAVLFLMSLVKLYGIRRKGAIDRLPQYDLVKTKTKGTPFSFFANIFWDSDTPVDTTESNYMLKHELAHVQQIHSLDKLFINLIQIIFWFNPFFWMIKRELSMIHEFLADKESFSEEDAVPFTRMTLKAAYPGYNWPANNSFFSSGIKRRLLMIVKNNRRQVGYFGRLMILPLAALIVILFSVKASATEGSASLNMNEFQVSFTDTIPAGDKNQQITIKLSPIKKDSVKAVVLSDSASVNKPIYLVDGKKITREELNEIPTDQIRQVSVLKGNTAVKKYGTDGKNGAIEITIGEIGNSDQKNTAKIEAPVVIGGKLIADKPLGISGLPAEVLIIVNGEKLDRNELSDLSPEDIQSVSVIKEKAAIQTYGEDARHGVIIITTKTGGEPILPKLKSIPVDSPEVIKRPVNINPEPVQIINREKITPAESGRPKTAKIKSAQIMVRKAPRHKDIVDNGPGEVTIKSVTLISRNK